MKTFLFEQYGYYPSSFNDNEFEIEEFKFKLLQVHFKEEDIMEMQYHINVLKDHFNGVGPFIIKNKYDKYLSSYENKNYALISVYNKQINIAEIIRFHKLFFKHDEYINLNKVLDVWKSRIERIEKNLSSYINKQEDEENIISKCMFCIGLATNAMQYLSDTISDLGEKLYGVGIAHRRFNKFDSFDLFNPVNFIVDSPCRDISFIIQNELISLPEISKILDEYNLDAKSARVLMSRMLYKCEVFDRIETRSWNDSLYFDIEKEIGKIKKAYSLLKNKYQIRPIDWLEN